MSDSGWKLIVEQNQKTTRSFVWCCSCFEPIRVAKENLGDEAAEEILTRYGHVLPSLGFRTVHPIDEIYLTRTPCANCGRLP